MFRVGCVFILVGVLAIVQSLRVGRLPHQRITSQWRLLSSPTNEQPSDEKPTIQASKPDPESKSDADSSAVVPPVAKASRPKSSAQNTDDELNKVASMVGEKLSTFVKKQIAEPVVKAGEDAVESAKRAVEAKIEETVTEVKNIPSNIQKAAVDAVEDAVESTTETIKNIPKNIQKAAVKAAEDAQKSALNSVENTKKSIVKKIQVRYKNAIVSPLRQCISLPELSERRLRER